MKLRDTVILVVLAHVGLVLVWICMGGCANDKAQDPKEEVAAITSEEEAMELLPMEVASVGPAAPITIEEEPLPTTGFTLPGTEVVTPALGPAETGTSPQEIRYAVRKGDTLWALSRKFKVSIDAIVDRNDIQNAALIREGRELIIPVAEAPEPEAPAPTAEAPAALPGGSEAVLVAEDAENAVHTVQPGDTVWKLARVYGTTSTAIMEANNITDATRIQIGQELRIPKDE